jgi:hypothetical protein
VNVREWHAMMGRGLEADPNVLALGDLLASLSPWLA